MIPVQLCAFLYISELLSSMGKPNMWVAIESVVYTHMPNNANQLKNCTRPNCFIVLGILAKSEKMDDNPACGCSFLPWNFSYSAGLYSLVLITVQSMVRINIADPM